MGKITTVKLKISGPRGPGDIPNLIRLRFVYCREEDLLGFIAT